MTPSKVDVRKYPGIAIPYLNVSIIIITVTVVNTIHPLTTINL